MAQKTTPRTAFAKAAATEAAGGRFAYAREVVAFYRAFPERRQDIFFVAVGDNGVRLVAPCPRQKDRAERLLDTSAMAQKTVRAMQRGRGQAVTIATGDARFVLLRTGGWTQAIGTSGVALEIGAPHNSREALKFFVLQHEIGHALCHGGMSRDANRAESVADAYASLCTLGKFGKSAVPFLDSLAKRAAVRLVLGLEGQEGAEKSHYTAPVIAAILKETSPARAAKMTAENIQAAAENFGARHHARSRTLQQAWNLFAPCKKKWRQLAEGQLAPLHTLENIVKDTLHLPKILEPAQLAIQSLLEGKLHHAGKRIEACRKTADRIFHLAAGRKAP